MNRILELRKEKKMTQPQLAALVNASRQSIGKWENGDIDLNTDAIARLCVVFNVTADYLLGLSSRRTAGVTEADAQLLHAYHAATPEIRDIIDHALEPYRDKKEAAAG